MTAAPNYLPHYTYDDYVQWEGRWELIDGHPIAMSPMPVPKHQWVASALNLEFGLAIRQKKCKHCRVYNPIDYKLGSVDIKRVKTVVIGSKEEQCGAMN